MKRIFALSLLNLIAIAQVYAGDSSHGYAPAVDAHHGDVAHHSSSGGLPQLDPSSYAGQAFWLIVVFVFLYIFFTFKSLPSISHVIENRAERVGNDLDSAARLKDEVQAVQKAYEESLVKAREEAANMFKTIEDDIKKRSDAHAQEFRDHSANKVDALEKRIVKAREVAIDEIGSVAADIALDAADKIIGVRPDVKDAEKILKSVKAA